MAFLPEATYERAGDMRSRVSMLTRKAFSTRMPISGDKAAFSFTRSDKVALALPKKVAMRPMAIITLRARNITILNAALNAALGYRLSTGAVAICVGIDFSALSSMTRLPDH